MAKKGQKRGPMRNIEHEFTKVEVARLFGVKRLTVHRWLAEGKLEGLTVRHLIIFTLRNKKYLKIILDKPITF